MKISPDFLGKRAAIKYVRIFKSYGNLTEEQKDLLAMYCENFETYESATLALQEDNLSTSEKIEYTKLQQKSFENFIISQRAFRNSVKDIKPKVSKESIIGKDDWKEEE